MTESVRPKSALLSPGALVLPLILFNSLAPYLGFQTVRVLSMFSNLRTEGGVSNHLFVPANWQLAEYQRDLVTIQASSENRFEVLAKTGQAIPYFELRRRVWGCRKPVTISFWRNGELIDIDTGRSADAARFPRVGWLSGKILAFRPVDLEGPCRCRW